MRLRVPAIDDPDFVADLSFIDGAVLRLAGSADPSAARGLGDLLRQLDRELRARHARMVVVDLQLVDVMAAACCRELLAWIMRQRERPAAERYKVRLRGNPRIGWQPNGLGALACFDTELVSVELPEV